jgi:hypothetical protein
MNERINELLKQSRTEYWTQYTPSYDYEKFAELIVKETMQVVSNQLPSNFYSFVAPAVIKHFGVEE